MSSLTLAVDGMTCASCAARIEKRLNKIDGVHASVNFATEQASIDFPDDVTADDLLAAVEATGYTATVHRSETPHDDGYLRRLVISAALSLPVLAMSMVSAWQFTGLAMAGPRAHHTGRDVGRVAVPPGRRSLTCATAPRRWTRWCPSACSPRIRGRAYQVIAGEAQHNLYLEVAAVVTTFILAGRYFEARAKRQSGAGPARTT